MFRAQLGAEKRDKWNAQQSPDHGRHPRDGHDPPLRPTSKAPDPFSTRNANPPPAGPPGGTPGAARQPTPHRPTSAPNCGGPSCTPTAKTPLPAHLPRCCGSCARRPRFQDPGQGRWARRTPPPEGTTQAPKALTPPRPSSARQRTRDSHGPLPVRPRQPGAGTHRGATGITRERSRQRGGLPLANPRPGGRSGEDAKPRRPSGSPRGGLRKSRPNFLSEGPPRPDPRDRPR